MNAPDDQTTPAKASPHRWAVAVIIVAVNLALLAAIELGVRFYLDHNQVYDIEMSRYARKLKIPSQNPRIGHEHRPGASAHLMGVDVSINRDGLRDRDFAVGQSASHRIIVLGDSLTFGWGVEFHDTFAKRLERSLGEKGPVEVLNFGHGNYNTVQEVDLFLDKGLAYEPDQVVLFFFINDAEETPVRSRWGFLERSELVSLFWSRLRVALSTVAQDSDFAAYYSALYDEDAPAWRATQSAFELLRDTCRDRDIELRVVLLPELHQLADYPFREPHDRVLSVLKSLGIPALDLAPRFPTDVDPKTFWVAPDDAHPNASAQALIAEYTSPFIEQGFR